MTVFKLRANSAEQHVGAWHTEDDPLQVNCKVKNREIAKDVRYATKKY